MPELKNMKNSCINFLFFLTFFCYYSINAQDAADTRGITLESIPFQNSEPPAVIESTIFPSTFQLPQTSIFSTIDSNIYPPTKKCSTNINNLWLDIQFVIETTAKAKSYVSLTELGEKLARIIKPINFDPNGKHTSRAGLITFGRENQIRLEMNSANSESLYRNFLLLDNFGLGENEYDLKKAIDVAAYRLLHQKSHRYRVLVIISTFGQSNNAGAEIQNLKNNGVHVITLNLSKPQPVVVTDPPPPNPNPQPSIAPHPPQSHANFDEGLATPGYAFNYFIPNSQSPEVWEEKFKNALIEINCVCPYGTMQNRKYDQLTKNYTISTDCYWGSSMPAYPSFPDKLCLGGVLASIRNPNAFEFITNEVIPKQKIQADEISIGLHKSPTTTSNWAWFGYDKSVEEYLNFPLFEVEAAYGEDYGYLRKIEGSWKLFGGRDVSRPFVCQINACDADNFCDLNYISYQKFLRKFYY